MHRGLLKSLLILRSFFGVITFLVITFVLCLLAIAEVLTFNRKNVADGLIRIWGVITCGLFGVRVKVEGAEHIPKTACLYLFNHSSFFDIFALVTVISQVRFGAKSELFKIPVFGRVMRLLRMLPIERGDVEKVKRVYAKAIERMTPESQFALSPEGGRSNSGTELLPFKSGPFIFAIQAQIPICPVVIIGASDILPKTSFLPNTERFNREIVIRFLPMVAVKGSSLNDKVVIQQTVRQSMSSFLNR